MDDTTAQTLALLAEKLGTTGEHLWTVLLEQAYIAMFTQITLFSLWCIFTYLWVRFALRKLKKPDATEDNKYPQSEWRGETAVFGWMSIVVILLTLVVWLFFPLATSITVILNPEYWALQKILNSL